jgi:outer membrane protein OmpA-like peptidoglycan-associated protein
LEAFFKRIAEIYGTLEDIEKIVLKGQASGKGDTALNLNLSKDRANYVKQFIWDRYKKDIPDLNIFPEGEPLDANDQDDDPEERRVDVIVYFRK